MRYCQQVGGAGPVSEALAACRLVALAIGSLATTGCQWTQPHASAPVNPQQRASRGIAFENIVPSCGIEFSWPSQPKPFTILAATGGGCGFIDYDDDGLEDVLLVSPERLALFHNLGSLKFQDVTRLLRLDTIHGKWMGVAVGDYDGDSRLDILVTGYRRLALIRNSGVKGFEDVTAKAGLDPGNHGKWALSAGFMDLDGSGWLSLVITNYVAFGPGDDQLCEREGIKVGCTPDHYRSEYAEIWQNVGGRFKHVTRQAVSGGTHGKGMALAFGKFRESRLADIYIANDTTPADLLLNQSGMKFRNAGPSSGATTNAMGHPVSGMGVDCADFDGDSRMDIAVTTFADEAYLLLRNMGNGQFDDQSDQTGIAGPTLLSLGFGVKWGDIDNDGWPDLLFANGHVYDNANRLNPLSTTRQKLMVFRNEPSATGRRFTDQVPMMTGDVTRDILGRGLATGDIDNDGRLDVLVVDYEGEPLLLHNVSETVSNWLTVDVRGPSPNHRSYGAIVTVKADDRTWTSIVSPAGSFLSSADPRAHFGLGKSTSADKVVVVWPDGVERTMVGVATNQVLRIVHPKPDTRR